MQIHWGQTINSLVGEQKEFKINAKIDWKAVQFFEQRGKMIKFAESFKILATVFCTLWSPFSDFIDAPCGRE